MNPLKDLPRVFSHEKLLSFSSKKNQHPAHLRQLASELIHNTPPDARNGCKFDSGNTGSCVVIENQDAIIKIKRRNPNHCSVFRSELIAINVALEHMISTKGTRDIWIFTDNSTDLLTYNEIYSKVKTENNRTWKTPPSHDWYQQKGPGATLDLKGVRKLQTSITRLIRGHTRGLTFVQGQKTFPVCLKCNVHQASSEHLLSCIGLEKNFILENPTMVYVFLLVNGLLDLV
ncbi:RNase H domain-containing protein [Trichonephila clavipes]|nr:RNase H domain-containing protein [Trichonephila clavipes]